jgi:hypothetical protein
MLKLREPLADPVGWRSMEHWSWPRCSNVWRKKPGCRYGRSPYILREVLSNVRTT